MKDLQLEDGHRYFACVYANATSIEYEKFTLDLPTVSTCSDGVLVDLEAPEDGKVWIGSGVNTNSFQVLIQ